MSKTKIVLLSLWVALGASIIIVNNLYYAEAIAGIYVINGFLEVLKKDYK